MPQDDTYPQDARTHCPACGEPVDCDDNRCPHCGAEVLGDDD